MSLNICLDRMGIPAQTREIVAKSIPVTEVVFGGTGLLDSAWTGHDNHLITAERKEIHDFVGRTDDLENQLKRAFEKASEVILIIEGILEPIDSKTCITYKMKKNGGVFYRDRIVNRPYKFYMGYIYGLDKAGVSTYWTSSPEGTAELLVEMVQSSNKPEFSTFKRYIRTKPNIATPNPTVTKLMGLGLGEKTSINLAAHFGSVWRVLNADVEELLSIPDVGAKTVEELFLGVGRIK